MVLTVFVSLKLLFVVYKNTLFSKIFILFLDKNKKYSLHVYNFFSIFHFIKIKKKLTIILFIQFKNKKKQLNHNS